MASAVCLASFGILLVCSPTSRAFSTQLSHQANGLQSTRSPRIGLVCCSLPLPSASPTVLMAAAGLDGDGCPPPQSEFPSRPPIKTTKVKLSSGTVAEVVTCVPPPTERFGSPPLVFVHGSYHAAWCWSERYVPFFASRGYPTIAISLKGTGGTPAGEGVKKIKIDEHVDDLTALLDYVKANADEGGLGLAEKPVGVFHSFGGLLAMRMLDRDPGSSCSRFAGLVVMCSVPPSGIAKLSMRSLRRTPFRAIKTTRALAMKQAGTNPELCRAVFFDPVIPEVDLLRYMKNFKRDSVATIDLSDLSGKLSSKGADEEGRAPFVNSLPPIFVLGGKEDVIVDQEGVEETARYFGVGPTMVRSPHDVMLCAEWQRSADAILEWLEEQVKLLK